MDASLVSKLSKTAAIYGYRLASVSEEDAHAIMAKDFQERAYSFLSRFNGQESEKYRGQIHVHVSFVEPLAASGKQGFDVFVAPLLFRKHHEFGVFISMMVLRGINTLLNYLVAGPTGSLHGLSEAEIEKNFPEVYRLSFAALVYILMHEYAHVLRAHIPYSNPKLYQGPSPAMALAMHEGENLPSDASHTRIRLHRSMEIEADLIALGLIVELLSNEEIEGGFLSPNAELNDPAAFGQSIFLLMRLMELWRQTLASEPYEAGMNGHPHPEIRQLFVDSWLMARQREDRGERFFQVTKGLQEGMDTIREKIYDFGPEFLPNLQYIMSQGKENVLKEYEDLQKDVYDYLKPGLAAFAL